MKSESFHSSRNHAVQIKISARLRKFCRNKNPGYLLVYPRINFYFAYFSIRFLFTIQPLLLRESLYQHLLPIFSFLWPVVSLFQDGPLPDYTTRQDHIAY